MTAFALVEARAARDVRSDIVRTTLALVGEHGVGGLSNRRIAQAAGVSLGTLTYHFPSQDDLLSAALSMFVDEEIERLAAIGEDLERRTVTRADLAQLVQQVVEVGATQREQIAQFELYVHASRELSARATARRCYDAYDRLTTAAMVALGSSHPERDAQIMLAVIEGVELRRLATGGQSLDLAEAVTVVLAALT